MMKGIIFLLLALTANSVFCEDNQGFVENFDYADKELSQTNWATAPQKLELRKDGDRTYVRHFSGKPYVYDVRALMIDSRIISAVSSGSTVINITGYNCGEGSVMQIGFGKTVTTPFIHVKAGLRFKFHGDTLSVIGKKGCELKSTTRFPIRKWYDFQIVLKKDGTHSICSVAVKKAGDKAFIPVKGLEDVKFSPEIIVKEWNAIDLRLSTNGWKDARVDKISVKPYK